jgi:hypothetical protein
VSQQAGTVAIAPNAVSTVDQQPTAGHQISSSANYATPGTGASLMEVSAFMTEQLKAQVVEQRAYDSEQHAEMMRLLLERDAKLEAQRQEFETKLEAQRKESESKLEAQRQVYETKLETVSQTRMREMQVQALTDKATTLQLRLEVLSESKLLEDEELSTIEDEIADALGAAPTDDGADRAWECVMQMVRLSEGIGSEKMFARQLRRKFL